MAKRSYEPPVIVGGDGPPCPRCCKPTQIREHKHIGEKELSKPFYFSRWYYCENQQCKTNTIMPEEFKVLNKPTLTPMDDVVVDALNERKPLNFIRGIDANGTAVTIGKNYLGFSRILWDDEGLDDVLKRPAPESESVPHSYYYRAERTIVNGEASEWMVTHDQRGEK